MQGIGSPRNTPEQKICNPTKAWGLRYSYLNSFLTLVEQILKLGKMFGLLSTNNTEGLNSYIIIAIGTYTYKHTLLFNNRYNLRLRPRFNYQRNGLVFFLDVGLGMSNDDVPYRVVTFIHLIFCVLQTYYTEGKWQKASFDGFVHRDYPFKTSAFLWGEGVKNWPNLPTDSSKKTADGGG